MKNQVFRVIYHMCKAFKRNTKMCNNFKQNVHGTGGPGFVSRLGNYDLFSLHRATRLSEPSIVIVTIFHRMYIVKITKCVPAY